MAIYNREMTGSPKSQGADEEIVYTYTVPTAWGAPGAATIKAYDITDGQRKRCDRYRSLWRR